MPISQVNPSLALGRNRNLSFICIHDEECKFTSGTQESVFGTNTTSKKPADIWVTEGDRIINLYEITVKKIDFKRLDDCLDSLNKLDLMSHPITFICRIPPDVKDLKLEQAGIIEYKGKPIFFVDICAFISTSLALLSQEQIASLVLAITGFVEQINRPIETKKGWQEIFQE